MWARRWVRGAKLLVLLATGAGVVYLSSRFDVASVPEEDGGMEPQVAAGSRVLIDRRPGLLAREEVVAFESAQGRIRTGRIAAVPGDDVETREGALHVNGRHVRTLLAEERPGSGRVPDGEILVILDRPEGAPWPTCERVREARIRGLVVLAWPF
jgi:hypothetical protein